MIWFTRFILASCLLCLAVGQGVLSDIKTIAADIKTANETIHELQEIKSEAPAVVESIESGISTLKNTDPGELLGQTISTTLNNPWSVLHSLFPFLSRFLLLGRTAPAIVGSALEHSPSPSASKVILVLAEDRDSPDNLISDTSPLFRSARQSPDGGAPQSGQFWAQIFSGDSAQNAGQMLAQAWKGLNVNPPQSPDQILGQAWTPLQLDMTPFTRLPQLPILGPQGSFLGAPLDKDSAPETNPQTPAPPPLVEPAAPSVGSPQSPPSAPAPEASPLNTFQNLQTALDNSGALLGQALNQPNNPFSLFGFKPLQSWPMPLQPIDSNPIDGAASEVSEVRVKPDFPLQEQQRQQQSEYNSYAREQAAKKLSEMQVQAALQEALSKKTIPILWFRLPQKAYNYNYRASNEQTYPSAPSKSTEDLQIEKKLHEFQQQVATELKQLQEIERRAMEIRAADEATDKKQFKESQTKLRYPLNKTPIHKITRGDIEKALQDEYVQRAILKAAVPKYKITTNINGWPTKRQAAESMKTMNKDDIIKLLAYAYRMATANGENITEQRQMQQPADGSMSQQRQWADKPSIPMPTHETMMQGRQWADEKAKQQMFEQRQMAEKQSAPHMQAQEHMSQQRQWADEQAKQQMFEQGQMSEKQSAPPMPAQQSMNQQRQWTDEQAKQQMFQQRQWADEKAKQQMFEQRQMAEKQSAPPMPDQQAMNQQRQWADEKAKQQMFQQRQWADEKAKQQMFQQRQWADKQSAPPMPDQQGMNQQRQWSDEQAKQHMFQQRQWADEKAKQQMFEQRQMAEKQSAPPMPDQQAVNQQRQWADEQAKQQIFQQRQWAEKQSAPPVPAQQAMNQQRQWSDEQAKQQMFQQRQWADEKAKQQMFEQRQMAEKQSAPPMPDQQAMNQQRQWADEQAKQQMFQQRQWADKQSVPPMPDQQGMNQQRQWTDDNIQQQIQRKEQKESGQPDQKVLVGEANPQMAENAGKARHGDIFDDFDVFGHHHKDKGHKEHRPPPTIINYYYTQGGSRYPVYGGQSYGGQSYGGQSYGATPYGGVAYGSNAYGGNSYRSATGNDEIETMLKDHQMLPKLTYPATADDGQPLTTHKQKTLTTDSTNDDKKTTTSESKAAAKSRYDFRKTKPAKVTTIKKNSTLSGPRLRFNDLVRVRVKCCGKDVVVRHKRNVNYATLQAIDQKSLDDLRRTYKESLKEITLNPDENPTDALMRYNAASIRDALEKASQEPLEVSGGEHEPMHVHGEYEEEPHAKNHYDESETYYDPSDDMPYGKQEAKISHLTNLNSMQHQHTQQIHQPFAIRAQLPAARPQVVYLDDDPEITLSTIKGKEEVKLTDLKRDIAKAKLDNTTPSTKIMSPYETPTTRTPKHYDHKGLADPAISTLIFDIQEQLTSCCNNCKKKILSDIKGNMDKVMIEQKAQTVQDEPAKCEQCVTRSSSSSSSSANKSVCPKGSKEPCITDDDHEEWLNEMSGKGYDRKYLTKAHQWQYMNSGKLDLTLDSREEYEDSTKNEPNNSVDTTSKGQDSTNKRDATKVSYTKTKPSTRTATGVGKKNDISKTSRQPGRGFGSPKESLYMLKDDVHAVNAGLSELQTKRDSATGTTMSPYTMRGKFVNSSRSRNSSTKPLPSIKNKYNRNTEPKLRLTPMKSSSNEPDPSSNQKAKMYEFFKMYDEWRRRSELNKQRTPTENSTETNTATSATPAEAEKPENSTSVVRSKRYRSRRRRKMTPLANGESASSITQSTSSRKRERSIN